MYSLAVYSGYSPSEGRRGALACHNPPDLDMIENTETIL